MTFLLIIAVPLICISLLSRELSDFVLTKATDQLLRDSSKSVALNLIDRLRGAEAILRILNASESTHAPNADASARGRIVFSEVTQQPLPSMRRGEWTEKPHIHVDSVKGEDWPKVTMVIADKASGKLISGVLNRAYLWENLESAFYTMCVGGIEFAQPHCQGPERPRMSTVEVERPFYFRPYFEGNPWTLLAVAAPDVADYLPIKLTELFSYVTAAALLLTLSVSAFFIRRATTPLDALITATNAVRHRNFSHIVPVKGMKDEFRDVADSFNVMSATIGRDMAFMSVLSNIDEAILEHRPLDSVIQLSLTHLSGKTELAGLQLTILDYVAECEISYTVHGKGNVVVSQAPFSKARLVQLNELASVPFVKTDTLSAFFNPPPGAATSAADIAIEIDAIKSRIAVAVNSEEHEKILISRAAKDSLTRLLNRLGLVERLDEMISKCAETDEGLAVVYLDLDGFKDVNDAYGHDTGDRLLQMVADRMATALFGRNAAIARLGGDEFVFILPIIDNEESYKKNIQAVLQEMQFQYELNGVQIKIGASLGVALYPGDGSGHDDLLRNADLAMYAAKSRGRNSVVYFEASLNSASAEKIELRRDLAEALEKNQMYLVYQPRVTCSDLSNRSAEALLRWTHPTRGNIPPDKFISIAEESGLIIDIGYWVLTQAIYQLIEWRKSGNISIETLSVNLSPIQLMHDGFMDAVEKILSASGIPASSIELEVTEGALINDIDTAVRKLKRLRDLGFTIALDDFGVGYSAMSYLSVLPFDTLKIDKSFVSGFGIQKSAYAIASAIVALAKALEKVVVAEGVETQEQASALAKLGVEELQGYFYSKPLKPDDLLHYLAQPRQP